MDKPFAGPETMSRMVARTTSLEEANRVAEKYEAEGYKAEIVKRSKAGITFFEVWVMKRPDVFRAPMEG